MADVAQLEVRLDGRAARLEAESVRRRLRALGNENTRLAGTTAAAGTGLTRQTVATTRLSTANAAAATSTTALGSSVKRLLVASATFAGLGLGAGALTAGTKSATSFSLAIAEVSTLIDESFGSLENLRKESIRFARTFGTSTTAQAQAFYQATSAGAGSLEEAVLLLNAANILARGGVADLEGSIDLLTTALNAYGLESTSALDVADILFLTVKQGKITVDQLAQSFGQIASISSSFGLTLEEVSSGVAALTKNGVQSAQAFTGIRALIISIVKPSEEARRITSSLGIEFNLQAVRTKGLVTVLREAFEATGRNEQAFARLLGSTEALTPATALLGNAGDDYIETLELMTDRANAASDANIKVADSLAGRLQVAQANVSVELQELGDEVLPRLVDALEILNENFDTIIRTLTIIGGIGAGRLFFRLTRSLNGIGRGIAFLTGQQRGLGRYMRENNETLRRSTRFLITYGQGIDLIVRAIKRFAALNPFGLALLAIGGLVAAVGLARKAINGTATEAERFDNIIAGNANTFVLWEEATISALRRVGRGFNELTSDVNRYLLKAGEVVADVIFTNDFIDPNQGPAPGRGPTGRGAAGTGGESRDVLTDFVVDENFERQAEASRARVLAARITRLQGLEEGNAALRKINGQLYEQQRLESIAQEAVRIPNGRRLSTSSRDRDQAQSLLGAARTIDEDRIAELRRLEFAAQNNSILSDKQRAQTLSRFRTELQALENPNAAYTSELQEQIDLAKIQDPLIRQVETSLASQIRSTESRGIPVSKAQAAAWREMILELGKLNAEAERVGPLDQYLESLKDVGDGFENFVVAGIKSSADALSSFILEGKSGLQGLANVLRDVAQQILSLALQRAVVAPIVSSFLPGFADGGAFHNGKLTAFASGGIISQPTLFPFNGGTGVAGEAGDEAIIPLKRGANGRLGVENFGGGGSRQAFAPTINVNIAGNVDSAERTQEIGRAAKAAMVSVYNEQSLKNSKAGGGSRR